MKISAELDLDELWAGDPWDTTIAEIVKEELKLEIRRSIKQSIKNDPKLKKALKKIQDHAADQIIFGGHDD